MFKDIDIGLKNRVSKLSKKGDSLQKLSKAINWKSFRKTFEIIIPLRIKHKLEGVLPTIIF